MIAAFHSGGTFFDSLVTHCGAAFLCDDLACEDAHHANRCCGCGRMPALMPNFDGLDIERIDADFGE